MDKSGRPGIILENLSFSEVGFRNSGRDQVLFDKDSCLGDAMKSITSSNKKDNAYIDNPNNHQQQRKQNNNKLYIQQTLLKDFFLDGTRSNSSGNIYSLKS
jgi:hypothetical protein